MGDYLMSLIKCNDIQNASGGIPTVKSQQLIPTAWVNFNGQNTLAIRDSEGVSSITDAGTGTYTLNFATAMANINYSVVLTADGTYNGSNCSFGHGDSDDTAFSTTAVRFDVRGNGSVFSLFDVIQFCAIVMGGQA